MATLNHFVVYKLIYIHITIFLYMYQVNDVKHYLCSKYTDKFLYSPVISGRSEKSDGIIKHETNSLCVHGCLEFTFGLNESSYCHMLAILLKDHNYLGYIMIILGIKVQSVIYNQI